MTTDKCRKKILILDSDRDVAELFARALETGGKFKCYLAFSEDEALNVLRDIGFDLLLVDLETAWRNEFAMFRKVKRLAPEILIVLDGYVHQKMPLTRAVSLGADGYLIKPIKIDSLRKKIEEFSSLPGNATT